MACSIIFKAESVSFSNMQFSRLLDFGIQVARGTGTAADQRFIDRLSEMQGGYFWPGRGVDILEDFPELEERKFWSRVFFDVSRAIFDRTVGFHERQCWQARGIHKAHGTAMLFESSVRDEQAKWYAESRDRLEMSSEPL